MRLQFLMRIRASRCGGRRVDRRVSLALKRPVSSARWMIAADGWQHPIGLN